MKDMVAKIRAALDAGDTEGAAAGLDELEMMYGSEGEMPPEGEGTPPEGEMPPRGEPMGEEGMEEEDEYGRPLKRQGMRPKEQATMADYFASKKKVGM